MMRQTLQCLVPPLLLAVVLSAVMVVHVARGYPAADRGLVLLDLTYALTVLGNAWRVLRGKEWHLLVWAADHL